MGYKWDEWIELRKNGVCTGTEWYTSGNHIEYWNLQLQYGKGCNISMFTFTGELSYNCNMENMAKICGKYCKYTRETWV